MQAQFTDPAVWQNVRVVTGVSLTVKLQNVSIEGNFTEFISAITAWNLF